MMRSRRLRTALLALIVGACAKPPYLAHDLRELADLKLADALTTEASMCPRFN